MSPNRAPRGAAEGADAVRSSGVQPRPRSTALDPESRSPETEDETAPRLSGQAVLDSRWAFEEVLGKERVERALATLPPSIRQVYDETTPLTWVPYSVMRAVHDAYGREAGQPVEALLDEVVPRAIARSFATVWRLLLRFTTDAALIARTPLLYSRTRSQGTMTARVVGPGEGEVTLDGWPSVPDRDIHALRVSVRAFLELAGREGVAVVAERTADGAVFRVTWKA